MSKVITILREHDSDSPHEFGTIQTGLKDFAHIAEVATAKPIREVVIPVYGYQHGGVIIAAFEGGEPLPYPFCDGWDSFEFGYISASAAQIKEWLGVKRVTKQVKEQAVQALKREINNLSYWLNGDVWQLQIEEDGELADILTVYGYNEAIAEADKQGGEVIYKG